jgi:glycogen debranching enzyme
MTFRKVDSSKEIYPFYYLALFIFLTILASCSAEAEKQSVLANSLEGSPSIDGSETYLGSPYVTAGNRVYMVGHQDGSFPELGWHITGEMGGIWDHPIKLMDGFRAEVLLDGKAHQLEKAVRFTNYPMANSHLYELEGVKLSIERTQFVPDGLEAVVVQYVLTDRSGEDRQVGFRFTGDTDLRPTWLAERQNIVDGQDIPAFDRNLDAWVVRDSINPWTVMFGADMVSADLGETDSTYGGLGTSNTLDYVLEIKANESQVITFFVSGSFISTDAASTTYQDIRDRYSELFNEKKARYEQIAERTKLTTPDAVMNETFEWLKYNSDWLVRTVPGIGTGFGAGIPDYPWWFGVDSEYSLRGYMAIGMEDVVDKTLHLLDSISMATNGNGRIVHEVSTNGVVFNPGNINETPQFASIVWEIYKWKGDRAFLERYFPTVRSGMEWLMAENDSDNNLFPDGFGMMEIHGMDSEMIDVASYTQRAFADASKMARALERNELADLYEQQAETMAKKINQDFWSEEFGSYADFIGTDEQALHLIEDAIVRADTLDKPWAVEELESTRDAILANPSNDPRPFVLHHNWVVNTPMEMGIADQDKAITALNTAKRFVNPFGVFVTGIDRDETAGTNDGSFQGSKVFSYTGAVMTLPTGVQAVAENNYGRPDEALDYLRRMTNSFSYALPGSMYEVSPDYGMIAQAWNIYSFTVPIVHQFFGLEPWAADQTILISPQMPSQWDKASIESIKVGDNEVSIYYSRSGEQIEIRVTQTNAHWKLKLEWPVDRNGHTYVLSTDSDAGEQFDDKWVVEGSGDSIRMILTKE